MGLVSEIQATVLGPSIEWRRQWSLAQSPPSGAVNPVCSEAVRARSPCNPSNQRARLRLGSLSRGEGRARPHVALERQGKLRMSPGA